MFDGAFDFGNAGKVILALVVVFVVLGLWKLIDIAIYLKQFIHISWGG